MENNPAYEHARNAFEAQAQLATTVSVIIHRLFVDNQLFGCWYYSPNFA